MNAHRPRRLMLHVFALLALITQVSAQWYAQQTPRISYLRSVHFADPVHGWIVGAYGTILYTTNGGANWVDESLADSTRSLWDVYALNEATAWVVGSDTLLLKTTDYGITWERRHINLSFRGPHWTANTVYFSDSLNGWIGGGYDTVIADTFFVLRTTDGGKSWNRDYLPYDCYAAHLRGTDSNHLYTTCYSCSIMFTTDGSTWRRYYCSPNNEIVDASFPTPSIGWITIYFEVAATYVSKSIDSGYTWTGELFSGCGSNYIFLSFPDTIHGWVVESSCASGCLGLWATTDGGATWNQQFCYTPTQYVRPQRMFFVDSLNGWLVGYGLLLHTSNGGISTGVGEGTKRVPTGFELSQNYPNPFNPSTTIKYKIPTSTHVTIQIYDLLGRVIATLVDQRKAPGSYTVEFHPGENVASGVLLCRMTTQFGATTRSLIVLK